MSGLVAALFAVDPCGLGGVALRSSACQSRDDWLALLKKLLPAGTPQRRIPLNINDAAWHLNLVPVVQEAGKKLFQ